MWTALRANRMPTLTQPGTNDVLIQVCHNRPLGGRPVSHWPRIQEQDVAAFDSGD